MNKSVKSLYRKYFKKYVNGIKLFFNTFFNRGAKKQCYICKKKFSRFSKFRNGSKDITEFIQNLNVVGSDVDNFRCYFCGCHDRIRHIFMYFDKIEIWKKFENTKVLHIAPESELISAISKYNPTEYTLGDLNPHLPNFKKIDVTTLQYNDNYFDFVICNHVLEHVLDYKKAISEIHRVLKPNGTAILQVPYSLVLNKNFEDSAINTDQLRLFFYDQEDHVRIFSKKHYLEDLMEIGFKLNILEHEKIFIKNEDVYYGVNKQEDFIQVFK